MQFSELLLLRDEFRDICECVNECVGLESAEARLFEASGLGVTVTKGCIDPEEIFHFKFVYNQLSQLLVYYLIRKLMNWFFFLKKEKLIKKSERKITRL